MDKFGGVFSNAEPRMYANEREFFGEGFVGMFCVWAVAYHSSSLRVYWRAFAVESHPHDVLYASAWPFRFAREPLKSA